MTASPPLTTAPLTVTPSAIRVGRRSGLVLALVSAAGLAMLTWPFLVPADPSSAQHTAGAPFVFLAVLPVLVVIVLAELSEGGMDAKALAMLGVLTAVNAALRPLGAGTGGIETVFFLMVLAGRVFGPGFGFVLGCTSLFASALVTAGIGPWLPVQMLCSAWIGLGAGLLPFRAVRGRAEVALLVGYGVVAAFVYGALTSLWSWPFLGGGGTELSYLPGGAVVENLERFVRYVVVTAAGWDLGRAVTTTVAILVLGPAVLATLRRASRRARFTRAVRSLRRESSGRDVAVGDGGLEACRDRPAEPRVPGVRPAERGHGEPHDVVRVDARHERLLAAFGMAAQRAVREADATRLVDRPDDAARRTEPDRADRHRRRDVDAGAGPVAGGADRQTGVALDVPGHEAVGERVEVGPAGADSLVPVEVVIAGGKVVRIRRRTDLDVREHAHRARLSHTAGWATSRWTAVQECRCVLLLSRPCLP